MNFKPILISTLFVIAALLGVLTGMVYVKNNNISPKAYATEHSSTAKKDSTLPQETIPVILEKETPSPSEAPVFDSEQYVVTMSDTKILIYKIAHDGSMQTIEEKHIDTGSIPRDDYARLYSGIIVATLEEAKQIVEDFIS